MRIGIVVDSACDLPREFLDRHGVLILPISLRIGSALIEDRRHPEETQSFYALHLDRKNEHFAESIPYCATQIETLFLERLVLEYDYVFCLTITSTRSPIYANAMQAARAILSKYKPIRRAAGLEERFGLSVLSTRNLFTGQAVPVAEAIRLIRLGGMPSEIGARLQALIDATHTYLIPADLFHIYKRASKKGDTSLGWGAYTLGSWLGMKPILHCHRDLTTTVGKVRGFSAGVEQLFDIAVRRIRAGVDAPSLCISYGGAPDTVHDMPGYAQLAQSAEDHCVALHISPMSKTAAVNVGPGALSLAFAASDHATQQGH
ncbi:DegV family protein [Azonexus sp.]|uniref:DegV family protein n=1 Tax=Azonexus sp. TaxID=1872668 RepID=UPI0039E2283E